MTEISSIPVLSEDYVVAFETAKDLGMILDALTTQGTSWLFIGGADRLPMQQTVMLSLGLRSVPRPVVGVECTPRYQSPGALGCEVRFIENAANRAAFEALLTVVAAAKEGGGKIPQTGDPDTGSSDDQSNPFSERESTAPDSEFSSFAAPKDPTRKIDGEPDEAEEQPPAEGPGTGWEKVEDTAAPAPVPQQPAAPSPQPSVSSPQPDPEARGTLSYRFTSLIGVDQLLNPAGGIEAPTPLGAEEGDERSHLLLSILEFLGMKHFTGVVVIEWREGQPVASTILTIRKGDLIKIEDQGEGQPDSEEALLRYLTKEKIVAVEDVERVRTQREESGKSVGNLLFEGGLLTLDRISTSMREQKEAALIDLLYREGDGVVRVFPKAKIKGHPIRVNLSKHCIAWVRKILLEQYRRNLDPFLAQWMLLYPEVDQEATRYPLTWLLRAPKEIKTTDTVLTGAILAQECYDLAPVSQHDLARLFFVLTRYGALQWRDLPKSSVDSGAVTVEDQLQEHLRYLQASNPFTRIGVHWATHPTDIETKYTVVARKYSPESRYAKRSDQASDLCRQISALLRSSRDRLMDRRLRIEERGKIVEISQGRFAAQFMEKQSRIIMFRGEGKLAMQTLEMAIEIFPDPRWKGILRHWKQELKDKI